MRFTPTPLAGAFILDIEAHRDDRGFFARSFCRDEMNRMGLESSVVQCSISFNSAPGTLRGMHWQDAPHEEDKLVRCVGGAIFDVIVDIRKGSPTYGKWFGETLTAQNRRALFIPKGFAHGFLTLEPDSEVFYQISTLFVPGYGRGFRWNDPSIGIAWPSAPHVISERDTGYPPFAEAMCAL
jgi:dTDP-4-dehydrorhamnose 3,5-epimerase